MKYLITFFMIALAIYLNGCASETARVTRVPADTPTDLSGYWNDTDSRLVSDSMIDDCLLNQWLIRFEEKNQRQPVVVVGAIRNLTTEHISENTFIKDLERAFVNSGKVDVVQGGEIRDDIRAERADQQEFASEETRRRMREETGADYFLTGVMDSIVDRVEGTKVVYYQVNLELIDIETNKKVWIGDQKIKKIVEHGRVTY